MTSVRTDWEEIDYKPEGAGAAGELRLGLLRGCHMPRRGGCSAPATTRPPFSSIPNPPGRRGCDRRICRSGTAPCRRSSGRYVYADTYDALGDQIHTRRARPGRCQRRCAPRGHRRRTSSPSARTPAAISTSRRSISSVFRLEPTSGGFPCKLAPALTVEKKSARRAAKKGAVVIKALCDEDCDLTAKATIVIKGGGEASSAKRKRKGREIVGGASEHPPPARPEDKAEARALEEEDQAHSQGARRRAEGGCEDRGLGDRGRRRNGHRQAQGEAPKVKRKAKQ